MSSPATSPRRTPGLDDPLGNSNHVKIGPAAPQRCSSQPPWATRNCRRGWSRRSSGCGSNRLKQGRRGLCAAWITRASGSRRARAGFSTRMRWRTFSSGAQFEQQINSSSASSGLGSSPGCGQLVPHTTRSGAISTISAGEGAGIGIGRRPDLGRIVRRPRDFHPGPALIDEIVRGSLRRADRAPPQGSGMWPR